MQVASWSGKIKFHPRTQNSPKNYFQRKPKVLNKKKEYLLNSKQ